LPIAERHSMQMQPGTAAVNDRGQYGDKTHAPDAGGKGVGAGWILLVLGISVGIYALSPGARHWYKHGYLPPAER
jgi:hypothetical protein